MINSTDNFERSDIRTLRTLTNTSNTSKPYKLNINITRHGPKESFGGPLSAKGRDLVFNHYVDFYSKFCKESVENIEKRKLISSPVPRAKETANIYRNVSESHYQFFPFLVEVDTRLSEYNLVEFVTSLPDDKQNDWFRYWYQSELGKKSVANFANWISEKILFQKTTGGNLQIDAFSHGPTMAGFFLSIEEKLNKKLLILPDSEKDRLNLENLFCLKESPFQYLSSFTVKASTSMQSDIILCIQGNEFIIPLQF